MLPTPRNKKRKSLVSTVKRALERSRQARSDEALRRAQAEAAALPLEVRHTMHSCGESAQPFMIVWHRRLGEPQFKIHEVVKLEGAPRGQGGKTKDAPAQMLEFSGDDFKWSEAYCPWCGWDGGFVQCSCGDFVCGRSSYVRNGVSRFHHKRCNSDFRLTPADTVKTSHCDPGQKSLPRNDHADARRALPRPQARLGWKKD